MRKFILIYLLIFSVTLFGASPVDEFLNNNLLQNANVSLLVKDLNSGKNLYEFRSNNSAVPASTMKIVTTATALEILGAEFRFETCLEMDGSINVNGVLNGNLYIRGGGDPTLGSEKLGDKDFLNKWVVEIKRAGIKQISGQIIVDGGIYDNEGVNPLWTWEDIGNYYSPGIYGVSYLDNTCKVDFKSGKVGTTPLINKITPEIQGFTVDNNLKSTNIGFDSAYFYGAPHSYKRVVYGEIPANRNSFVVKSDMPNPGLLLALHLQQKLLENGFKFSTSPTDEFDPKIKRKLIYKQLSPTLKEIITETNFKSNNFYAEAIFRYLGTKYSTPAGTNLSIQVVRDYWKSKGLPVNQLVQYDGCGLSPADLVSANFFVQLLSYMNNSKNKDVFYNSLPVSGESGTLASFLKNSALQGKVHAKSGTITRVKSYAGYIDNNGKKYAFALLVNNANGSSYAVTKKMEKFLLSIE